MEYTIEEVISRVDSELPSLSPTAAKVIQLANNINCPPGELTKVIRLDPVLSMKVMRLVNSSYFNIASKVVSLEKAIIMLGLNTIKNLALSAAVLAQFESSSEKASAFDVDGFWRHSLGVGVTAKMLALAKGIDKKEVEDFFLAGMSHCLGVLVESFFYPDEMEEAVEQIPHMGLIAAEEYALCGLNHCQVGCALAKKWGLPQGMVTAMKNYYSADTSEGQDDYVLSVHLASAICKNNSVGLVMDKVPVKVAPDAWTKLGLDPAVETKILSVLNEEIDKATEFLKV